MKRRDKRRLKRLQKKVLDAEFARLDREEEEERKRKRREQESADEQLLAEMELEAGGQDVQSKEVEGNGFVKQTDSEFMR